jgi:hypothetical protein
MGETDLNNCIMIHHERMVCLQLELVHTTFKSYIGYYIGLQVDRSRDKW